MLQQLIIQGPAGDLETIVEQPLHPIKLIAIICHPHPLHGGTMNNKVVTTVSRACLRLGITVVRFNFRGVGLSGGHHGYSEGEVEDLQAVIAWVKHQYPDHRIILGGFSFGAYIAARVAMLIKPLVLILIAPAVHHQDFASLPTMDFPLVIIQGDADEVVPPAEVFNWAEKLLPKPEIITFPGVSHFFHGELIVLRDQLILTLRKYLE